MAIQTRGWVSLLPTVIAACIFMGDRISKIAVRQSIGFSDNIPVVPGWFRIVHTENAGAAFGVLAEGNAVLRSAVLIGISSLVLVSVAVALWGRRSQVHGTVSRIGLALILGGALGNMYDRLFRGTVTDFIEVYHGLWSFPAFNVADSAITVGGALLIFDLLYPGSQTHLRNRTEIANK